MELRLKSSDDIGRIQESGRIISEIFRTIEGISLEGRSTAELDSFIEDIIFKSNAMPSFKTVIDYNYATCISLNHEVVHGIPGKKKKIGKGDIVKIDIGVVKKGYFADACYTFTVEPVSETAARLVKVTRESLNMAIGIMNVGNMTGDIGSIIQHHVEENGFSVVRDFSGHGVGFSVHELPGIPHFGVKNTGLTLREGMVLAVEPIVNEGSRDIVIMDDGWTAVTSDGKLSAQFEHTIAVTKNGPVILT